MDVFVGWRYMEPSKPLKSCLKKFSNIDGNILSKDGKPIKVMRNVHIGTMVTSGVSSGSSATHIQTAEKLVTSSHDEQQHHATCFKAPTTARVVRLTEMKNKEVVQGANVAIPLPALKEISNSMLVNGFFFFQFATKEDAYTSTMCQKSRGRNTYARALVEVSSETDQKDSLVVAIPFPNGKGHSLETTKAPADVDENDGFTQVTRKHGKGKQEGKGKQVAGIRLSKLKPNMVYQVVHKPPNNNDGTSSSTKNDDVQPPKPLAISSNEADKKEVFCSSVYAHNRYIQRRKLWHNLLTHKHYMRNRSCCLLGDFNVSLFVDEKSTGSSFIDTGMRDSQDYVDAIEMSDVNSTGLRFTWNQKPKGDNCVLKKTDRIMANIEFYTSFVGSSAIFQPYRISDHSLAVLHVPMISHIKPCPFKFSNILMFRVVKRLKFLKNTLCKLLNYYITMGTYMRMLKNFVMSWTRFRFAIDKDPDNIYLREEAAYLLAFNDASLLEEKLLMQKAKSEWLKSGDSKLDYFHKAVKSQATKNQIDSITTTHGINVDRYQVPLAFIDHYSKFLGHQGANSNLNTTNLFHTQLSNDVATYMVREVSD
nr:hypothetical protein [Tanacetum cinerariifolium]